jgi:methylmalonyl-CoA/ethylmalonyl-CoA epimerase
VEDPVAIERISHIGIAVRDLSQQISLYRDVLGLPFVGLEEVEDQGVRVALFRVGEVTVELLEPKTQDSPIAKFLQKHGEGIHHLAYAVQDLPRTLEALAAKGVELIDKEPRRGAGGRRIAFLHPRSTHGVLTELCE